MSTIIGLWPSVHWIVSILVFVELALDVQLGLSPDSCKTATWVSILVFVELALDVRLLDMVPAQVRVSILVFVELALDDQPECPAAMGMTVSILVFVELALDACYQAGYVHDLMQFQSLFSWNLLLM